jgi:mono/diheme cytochrome c family protein
MKPLISNKPLRRVFTWLVAVILALGAASMVAVRADDTKPTDTKAPDAKPAQTKPADTKAAAPAKEAKPAEKKATKKLSGSELYAIHCNRCHAERYATEFSPNQWKTLITHMRVRANLPASQAKQILKYLQEDAGTP